jgi:hypothetical protein
VARVKARTAIGRGVVFVLMAAYQSWAHADVSQVAIDFVTHSEIVVNADAGSIWPYLMNLSEWKKGPELVPIDNKSSSVGGRYKVVAGNPSQVAYIENVEVVPAKLRTIRVDNPDGFYGYASWRLTSQDGQSTLVQYDVYMRTTLSVRGAQPSSADIAAARKNLYDAQYRRFAEELAVLKRLVESSLGDATR